MILEQELAECLDLPQEINSVSCPFCYKNLFTRYYGGVSLLECKCDNDFFLIKNTKNPAIYMFDSLYFTMYGYSIISTPRIQNVYLAAPDRLEVPRICLDFRNIDILKQRLKLYLSHDYY